MNISYKHIIIFLMVLGAALTGCTRESQVLGPEPGAYRFSGSPDALMDNFRQAYEEMDVDEYSRLLHEDFIFSFQACDVEKLGLSKDHYTRDEELRTTGHMFGRKPYVKSTGQVVDPILKVEFLKFELAGGWVAMDDPDKPGLLRAVYEVDIRMDRGRAGWLSIRGTCVFFAVGSESSGYHLIGWVDRTGGC
jgi:hypothetical protein